MPQNSKTLLLDKKQIEQRINRIAFQIYEDCYTEKEIIIAGIRKNGYLLAEKIEKALKEICKLKTTLVEIKIDKDHPLETPIEISMPANEMHGKVVILVDDVLNSGKTLMYSLRKILNADLKKLRTVLLVDRDHKRYPVNADFVGITLSTTLQEHITCDLKSHNESVYLS
ncbi:MAG: phosphoribosyltransferase [Bacteroidia bacterium]|nr:phosphoribosyltransferase [Bacteroidia bacterium]